MLVARSGLSPVMVGRDAELAELRRAFASVAPPVEQPAVVVVSGEAGVGKTRLLREFGASVEADGGAVLAGRAEEITLAPPFGVLRDALQTVVTSWDDVPESLAPRAHALRHVLSPLLVEHGDGDDHEHTPDELLRAAVELVRHVVDGWPTVLVFEDLHWADAESIALFTRLAATPGLPALLVATFRPEEFDRRHPLAHALPALERQRSIVHLPIGRLSEPALARMLEAVFDRPVPTAAVAALHRRTQGNPFFVEELVAGCGCADPAELATAPLPWNAAEAVLRRVDELDEQAARVLSTAALLGSRVPFDLLAAVVDLDEDALIRVLHVLVDRGLLVEADIDVFAFRHALTREAVASRLLGREQRRIHQAALEVLETQGSDDVLALAHRAAGAGQWRTLVRYACEGAERLLREGSPTQALQLAELGISRAETITPREEITLRTVAAQASWLRGMVDVSRRHAEQWRLLAVEEGLAAAEAAAWRHESMLRWHLGDREGYWQAVRRARAVAEPLGPSVELAWCYAFESQAHMLDGDAEEAVRLADRALALAEEVDAPQVRPWALVNKGMVLAETPGREREGLRLLEQAAEESLAHGDVMAAIRAYNNALVHYVSQRPEIGGAPARRLLARGQELARRYGSELLASSMALHALDLALADGDLAAAEQVLAEQPAMIGDPHARVLVAYQAFLANERGDVDAASEALDRAEWPTGTGDALDTRAWWEVVTLQVAARAGDRAHTEAAFQRLEALVVEHGWHVWRAQLSCAGVLAGLQAGLDRDHLRSVLERGTEPPGERPAMYDPAWRWSGLAAIALADGEHEQAAQWYRRVLEEMRVGWAAWMIAEVRCGLARALAALGSREEAREHAEEALRLLERWPGWRRTAAEELLARMRGRAEQRQASAGLTPREREVLELIAEGLSNREIAERLYIATKTAAVHVSNILAKSGASSRTEAVAWGMRAGVLSGPAGVAAGAASSAATTADAPGDVRRSSRRARPRG